MAQTEYRTHAALTFNVLGQTVEFYPPIDEILLDGGPPTVAATYTVFRGTQSDDDAPVFQGTATLDPVSTSTDDTCGPMSFDRTRVPITTTANVVIGRRYLLSNVPTNGSQRQVVIPKVISANDSVNHEAEIWHNYDPLSTFKGLRHSFVIFPAFITDSSSINIASTIVAGMGTGDTASAFPPYRVRWSYATGGGALRQHWTTFDVCRAPLAHGVTVDNVKRMVPDVIWDEWTQQRGMDFAPQIAEAFERVRFDIRMAGYDPNMVTDPLIVDRLVTLAAVARIMRALEKDPAGDYEKDYRNAFEKAIGTGLRAWMQTDSTGAITPSPVRQLWLER